MNAALAEILHSPLISILDMESGPARRVLVFPDALLLSHWAMRHIPSYALIENGDGQLWLLGTTGVSLNLALASAAAQFLSASSQRLTWPQLEIGLADHLELTTINLLGPDLPSGLLGDEVFNVAKIAGTFLSQYLARHSDTEVDVLKEIQSALYAELRSQISGALATFIDDPRSTRRHELRKALSLPLFNATAEGIRAVERRQFAAIYPCLSSWAHAHDATRFFRLLRDECIDQRRSPVEFLSRAWSVSPATIRSFSGVTLDDLGSEFASQNQAQELAQILNAIPAQHRPKSREHWAMLSAEYVAARTVHGKNHSSQVFVIEKIKHALKSAIGSVGVRRREFTTADIGAVRRLRAGLISAAKSHVQSQILLSRSLEIFRTDEIAGRVDRMLGTLAWTRLQEMSKRWDYFMAAATERHKQEIDFIADTKYFDYLLGGYLAPNGNTIESLVNDATLRKHGKMMSLCLANGGFLSRYSEQCHSGNTFICVVSRTKQAAVSIVEFSVDVARNAHRNEVVDFSLVQHKAPSNGPPPLDAVESVDSLRRDLRNGHFQRNALHGLRVSNRKRFNALHPDRLPPAMLVASLEAFNDVFGSRCAQTMQGLLEAKDAQSPVV